MNRHVIQYGKLEEFIDDPVGHGNIVRVVILDISKPISTQIPDLRKVEIGVHVRTINAAGHILACYLPVAVVQLYNGRREGDPTWKQYDEAWKKGEILKERVIAFLEEIATEKGFTVCAAGVINMGEIRPLRATWLFDSAQSEKV